MLFFVSRRFSVILTDSLPVKVALVRSGIKLECIECMRRVIANLTRASAAFEFALYAAMSHIFA
eukprot:4964273-Pleurochrysis_carterae.AAC.1